MQSRPTADRTRSRRWRSGTRRNKRHPIAHNRICPMPRVCLVHGKPTTRHPAMAMRLTRCEQQWVEDVWARRVHTHGLTAKLSTREAVILAVRQRINTKRMADAGIVNASSSPSGRLRQHRPRIQPVRPSAAISDPAQVRMDERHADMRAHIGAAIQRSTEAVIAAQRKLDISDRWYPRG